ncbi:MAG: ion channel [Candidatus Caldarchaeum sp.]|uniref:Ion transport domain-containing protein n=1 Tax=Caldiarchaeum subterraneum TaxID=311458 RepID=A0A7C5Q9M7_CALS0
MASRWELTASMLATASICLILVEHFVALEFAELFAVMAVDGVIVVVLLVDLLRRAKASGNAPRYVLSCWYEAVALLPLALFYFLETQTYIGAVLRGFRFFRLLRLAIAAARTARTIQRVSQVIIRSRLAYLLAVSAAFIFVGTLSAYILEVDVPESKIRDLGDAFWWSLATVTTVGYGDVVPVTLGGRIIGSILMVTGIAVIGVFISTLGSTLLSTARTTSPITSEVKDIIKNKLDVLETLSEDEVNKLIELIKTLHSMGNNPKSFGCEFSEG